MGRNETISTPLGTNDPPARRGRAVRRRGVSVLMQQPEGGQGGCEVCSLKASLPSVVSDSDSHGITSNKTPSCQTHSRLITRLKGCV